MYDGSKIQMELTNHEVDLIFKRIDIIENLYSDRKMTQNDIAIKLNMQLEDVGYTLRQLNFSYTRRKEQENSREGEKITPTHRADDFKYLLKYNFE